MKTSSDKLALAIILVENKFRPTLWRYIEYTYVTVLSLLKIDFYNVSVGLGQIQVKYWMEYYKYDKYSIFDINKFEDLEKNHEIVKWYLSKFNISKFGDISFYYTGKKNKYYELILREKITKINGLL